MAGKNVTEKSAVQAESTEASAHKISGRVNKYICALMNRYSNTFLDVLYI